MDFSSSIFQKLSQKIPTETIVRDFLMEYLDKQHKIVLERKQIVINKNILNFKVSTIVKTKLQPLQKKILEDVNEFLKERGIQISIKKII